MSVDFQLWHAAQRFFAHVGATIRQLATDGLSLRQRQVHLSEHLSSSVGLRTINAELHAIQQRVALPLASVAPVLLDAMWTSVDVNGQ